MGGRRLGSGGFGPDDAKQCPACDEIVAPHAVACRHCGVSLTTLEPGDDPRALRGDGAELHRPFEEDATERRNSPRDGPKAARGEASPETSWNVPHGRRPGVAPPEAQWTESDFERISQTAGLPREDPRAREPRRRRSGFRPWRRQQPGSSALGGVVAAGRAVKTDTRTAWIGGAIALAIVGGTAGWVAGRWDEESWIGRQYQLAADLMQSVKPLPNMLEGAAPGMRSPTAEVRGESPPVAVAPPARQAAPGPTAPGPAAGAPTVVSPRPAATPPAGPVAGGERTASLARPATSLVPIKPTTEPAPLAEAPPPALTTEPWSVRDVQRELARLGYYRGGVDGEVGPMTRDAVRAFQQDTGMRPTGRIEPALLTALSDRIAENTTRTNNPRASP